MKKLFSFVLLAFVFTVPLTASAQCDAPAGLAYSYSNNVTTFTWDAVPGATEYFVAIDWAGGQWGFGEEVTTTNSYAVTGLMQGGNFQWRVKANCGSGYSAYTAALFSTPCLSPYSLSTTNITTSSAVLNWVQSTTNNNNNTGFSVSYRLANTNNAWIQLTNIYNNPTATFFNLTGLAAATAYEWRVRRVCSFSNSDYIYNQFVTLSCISNGSNTSEWISQFSLGSINRVSGAEAGGYANTAASTDLTIGSTNNAGQIGAGFSGNARNERFMVYIDFNRNGSFADGGESLIMNSNAATINGTAIKNFTINIPATATPGPTRMRVFMRRNPGALSPCVTGYWGETEDYNINLTVPLASVSGANAGEAGAQTRKVVYPNPSSGIFTINLPNASDAVLYEVLNMNGAVIQQQRLVNAGVFKVDITGQPGGVYLLRVTTKLGNRQLFKLNRN
jgi:hypothetical protein